MYKLLCAAKHRYTRLLVMKDFPPKNIIEEWLKNSNTEIEKQVWIRSKTVRRRISPTKTKTVEEELLEKIKFALHCNNEAQAIRMLEQYKYDILYKINMKTIIKKSELKSILWHSLPNLEANNRKICEEKSLT